MKFFCDQCNAQYMIADEKVGPRGVKVKCKKCTHVIVVKPADRTTVDAPAQQTAKAAGGKAAPAAPRRTEAEISGAFDSLFGNESPSAAPSASAGVWSNATKKDSPASATGEKEWYVAIEDAQVGPVGMSELTQRWDAREITENSLAWKAGMPDWVPIADIPELSRLITDRPQTGKAGASSSAGGGALSSSGSMRVSNASAPVEWKPSAASALSSLVQEELIAAATTPKEQIAKPPTGVPDLGAGFGTNDLFGGKVSAPSGGDSFNATPNWSVPSTRSHSKPLYFILGGIGVVVLGLLAAMFMILLRPQPVAVVAAAAPQHVATAQPVAPAAATPPPAAAAATPPPAEAKAAAAADDDEGDEPEHKGKHKGKKKARPAGQEGGQVARATPVTPPPAAAEPAKASLTKDDIWNVVKVNAGKTMPCLKAARSRNEIVPGKYTFVIDWTIRPNGSVGDARLKGPANVMASSLPGCFSTVISQWRFPPSQAGAPITNFPFGPVNVP